MDEQDLLGFGNFLLHSKRLMDRTVVHYLGYYKLFNIARATDQEYINQFAQDHKNHSLVRGFLLNYLQYKGLDHQIRLPVKSSGSEKKRIIRDISPDEIKTLRDYLYSKSFRHGLIFDLIYQGALRRVEVTTIKLKSFRWKEWLNNMDGLCELVILGKGNKERIVFINPETVSSILTFYNNNNSFEVLEDLERFINSDKLLFTRKDGTQIGEKVPYFIIKKGSLKCLGRDIRTHELRHARANELEKRGLTPQQIQTYLGHVNLATTEIYLHRNEKEHLGAIRKALKPNEDYLQT